MFMAKAKNKGDIHWRVPNKKKPIAYSTVATSNLIGLLAQECETIQDVYDAVTYDIEAKDIQAIEISATSFPGTYYVTGDTYARNEANGEDEFFQFIIPKAKVQSENTITLEAEGDPSVFNMSLRVMRPADGKMMKLVKYSVEEVTSTADDVEVEIIHNHALAGANQVG
jgi:hypothetical protein